MGRKSRIEGRRSYTRLVFISAVWVVAQAHADGSNPVGPVSEVISAGRKIFAQNCSVGYCHGKGGRAGRGPRLRGKIWDSDYLYRVTLNGVPKTSMPGWKGRLSREEILSVVAYIQTLSSLGPGDSELSMAADHPEAADLSIRPEEATIRPTPEAKLPAIGSDSVVIAGNPKRGEEIFFDVTDDMNCAVCHRINGKGASVGFGLGGIAKRAPPEILQDIVLPNARVEDSGRLLSLTLEDGEESEVLRVGESSTRLKFFDVSSFPPVTRSIRKEDIRSLTTTDRSAMPDTYAGRYTLQQLLDLVAYLKSIESPPNPPITLTDIL